MNKKITILGIESSCDETAVSVIREQNGKIKILSNIVSSQFDIHKESSAKTSKDRTPIQL